MNLELLKTWIKNGEVDRAKDALRALHVSKIKRADRLPLAQFARDIYWGEKAVQILYPIVRPARRSSLRLTTEELATYGAALIDLRRNREGLDVLVKIPEPVPFVSVIGLAWGYFRRWEWEHALAPVARLLARPGLSTAERLEAEMTQATAVLFGAPDPAAALIALERIAADAARAKLVSTAETSIWMAMQCHYFLGDLAGARAKLAAWRGGSISPASPRMRLREEQWELLIEMKAGRAPGAAQTARLQTVVRKMQEMGLWDWARDCFYYLAVSTRDVDRMTRLYFGTSLPGLRRRLLREFGVDETALPAALNWRVGHGRPEATFDLATGQCSRGSAALKPGQVSHRLVCALAQDFFVGQSGPELHDGVFPGDHFNPHTSLHRLGEAIHRVRRWFAANRVPLTITEHRGFYRLDGAPVALVRVPRLSRSPLDARLEILRRRFGAKPFSALDAATALGQSRNSALGWLREAIESDRVARLGAGPAARYRLS